MASSLDSNVSERPVGVFDSGVGGLSVLRAIRQELPDEDLLYVGDSGFAPYGDKPGDFIRERAAAIVGFLINEGAKAIVVACNTTTGIAVDDLALDAGRARRAFRPPIANAEPTYLHGLRPVLPTRRSALLRPLARALRLSRRLVLGASGARGIVLDRPSEVTAEALMDAAGLGQEIFSIRRGRCQVIEDFLRVLVRGAD